MHPVLDEDLVATSWSSSQRPVVCVLHQRYRALWCAALELRQIVLVCKAVDVWVVCSGAADTSEVCSLLAIERCDDDIGMERAIAAVSAAQKVADVRRQHAITENELEDGVVHSALVLGEFVGFCVAVWVQRIFQLLNEGARSVHLSQDGLQQQTISMNPSSKPPPFPDALWIVAGCQRARKTMGCILTLLLTLP